MEHMWCRVYHETTGSTGLSREGRVDGGGRGAAVGVGVALR